jgi:hypothetical protein
MSAERLNMIFVKGENIVVCDPDNQLGEIQPPHLFVSPVIKDAEGNVVRMAKPVAVPVNGELRNVLWAKDTPSQLPTKFSLDQDKEYAILTRLEFERIMFMLTTQMNKTEAEIMLKLFDETQWQDSIGRL